MIRSFQAVFFDVGGTLFYPYPSVGQIYHEVAARHGCRVEPEKLEKLFREAWRRRDGLSSLVAQSSEKIERSWWRDLVEEVFSCAEPVRNFDVFFDELYDVFGHPDSWRLFPETVDILKQVKSQGKILGAISNWDSRLFQLIKGLGLEGYFDFVLASAVFGASKPSPKIFQEALRLASLSVDQAIHIGDSFEDDIRGANGVGMQAILIDRHHAEPPHYPANLKVIRNLKEIL